jgi:hypothetical protein
MLEMRKVDSANPLKFALYDHHRVAQFVDFLGFYPATRDEVEISKNISSVTSASS